MRNDKVSQQSKNKMREHPDRDEAPQSITCNYCFHKKPLLPAILLDSLTTSIA